MERIKIDAAQYNISVELLDSIITEHCGKMLQIAGDAGPGNIKVSIEFEDLDIPSDDFGNKPYILSSKENAIACLEVLKKYKKSKK